MTGAAAVRRFSEIVDESGVADMIEIRLRGLPDDTAVDVSGSLPATPGRPRLLSVRALLILLMTLAAEPGIPMYLKYAHKLATKRLSRSTRRALGISRTTRTHNDNGTISFAEEVVTLRQVRYLFDEIARCVSELDGGSSAGIGEVSGDLPGLADALATITHSPEPADDEPNHVRLARLAIDLENTVRRELFQTIVDLLIDASIPPGLPYSGAFAADETNAHAWHRPHGSRPRKDKSQPATPGDSDPESDVVDLLLEEVGGIRSYDQDARWGHKTSTPGDRNEFYFGYSVTAMVRINPTNAGPGEKGPILADRLIVRPAASSITEPGITAVDSLQAAGKPVTELLADRAYSHKVPEDWKRPMRERGVNLVFDLHPNDRGCLLDTVTGVLWIDGHPYCHDTPVLLRNIKRPNRLKVPEDPAIAAALKANRKLAAQKKRAKKAAKPRSWSRGRRGRERTTDDRHRKQSIIKRRADKEAQRRIDQADLDRFNTQIAKLGNYALRRVAGPDPTGKERYEDPARAGRLSCSNCTVSMFLSGVPSVANPPDLKAPNPPKICTARTVTFQGHVQEKTRQLLRWGTPEWIDSYSRRTHVEGLFGRIKAPGKHGLAHGWTRIAGIVRTTLMLAMVVIAVNEQAVRTWRKANPKSPEAGGPTDPGTPNTPGSVHDPAGENPAEPLAPDKPLAS